MKNSQLSDAFDAFDLKAVTINTKLQIQTKDGYGIMTYRGILIDKDDFLVYLGYNEDEVTTAIKWEDISTIELLNTEDEIREELNQEPQSGAKN